MLIFQGVIRSFNVTELPVTFCILLQKPTTTKGCLSWKIRMWIPEKNPLTYGPFQKGITPISGTFNPTLLGMGLDSYREYIWHSASFTPHRTISDPQGPNCWKNAKNPRLLWDKLMEMSHFQCKKPTLGGSSHLYTWTFQRVPNGFKGCQLTIPLGLFGTPWKVLVGSNYLVSPIYKPFGSFGTGITPVRGLTITIRCKLLTSVLGWSAKHPPKNLTPKMETWLQANPSTMGPG